MESVYNFDMKELLGFSLVLLRMAGFVVTFPIFGTNTVPASIKVLFALTMTFIFFPQVAWQKLPVDIESLSIVTLAAKEVFVGLTFGFIARLFFFAISIAGELMSVSLGVSAAQLFNPALGEVSTAFDQFYVILASMFFLAINGHQTLVGGIFQTFDIIPLAKLSISFDGFRGFSAIVQEVTAVGLKMCSPVLVSILFMNVAIAVIGKAVPQINILITSLPVNILLGLFVMFMAVPLLIWQMDELANSMTVELFKFIRTY